MGCYADHSFLSIFRHKDRKIPFIILLVAMYTYYKGVLVLYVRMLVDTMLLLR